MDWKIVADKLEGRMRGFPDVARTVEALATGRIAADDAATAWKMALESAWAVRNDAWLHRALVTEHAQGGPLAMIDSQRMRADIDAVRVAFLAEMPPRLDELARQTARALAGDDDGLEAALRRIPIEPVEMLALGTRRPQAQNTVLSGLNAMLGQMMSMMESRRPAKAATPGPIATLPDAVVRVVVAGSAVVAVDMTGAAFRIEEEVQTPVAVPPAAPTVPLGMKEPSSPVRAWVPLDDDRVLAVGGGEKGSGGWVAVGHRPSGKWTFLDDYDAVCMCVASRGDRHIVGMSDGTALLFEGEDGELGLAGGCDVADGESVTAVAWLDDDHIVGGTDRGNVVVAEVLG